MPGEGQFVTPVQVEVTSDIGADVAVDGTAPPGNDLRGLAVMGYYQAGNKLFVIRTDANGNLVVSFAPTPPVPGTVITTPPDTAVGVGATVPLPVPPVGTVQMTIENTGPAGTWIRIREVGGTAGSGLLLPRLGQFTYGGADGAIAAMEAQDVSLAVGGVAVATTVCTQFQRT
jgi:hypothetical protein